MSHLDATERSRRQRLIEELSRFRNQEAICRDGSKFSRVRVDDVQATDDSVAVKISLVPTPGLDNRATSWELRKPWAELKSAYDLWVSPYVSAKYYFERGLVEFLLERLERIANEPSDESRFDSPSTESKSAQSASTLSGSTSKSTERLNSRTSTPRCWPRYRGTRTGGSTHGAATTRSPRRSNISKANGPSRPSRSGPALVAFQSSASLRRRSSCDAARSATEVAAFARTRNARH
jgi:hypothetical protein